MILPILASVANSHHYHADPEPDPACHFDADPDQACHFDVDPDPDPIFNFDADPTFHCDVDPDSSFPNKGSKPRKSDQKGS
jgi:hypothetical protein